MCAGDAGNHFMEKVSLQLNLVGCVKILIDKDVNTKERVWRETHAQKPAS